MKKLKVFGLCVLVFVFLIVIAACSNGDSDSSNSQTSQQDVVAETSPEPETVEQTIPIADSSSNIESLLGSWLDISDSNRFANILKAGEGYELEDNESKYPATFENGILKVKVSDTETADVYIDSKTGNMLSVYQGNISEYRKK